MSVSRFKITIIFAAVFSAGGAMAQYLPTPAPDENTDLGTGANIGCERAYGVAACGGNGAAPPAPPPKAPGLGAMAVSPDLSWGNSWNYSTQTAAQAAAIKNCEAHSKSGCKIVSTVADVCVA